LKNGKAIAGKKQNGRLKRRFFLCIDPKKQKKQHCNSLQIIVLQPFFVKIIQKS
jgi:hypothetical protein